MLSDTIRYYCNAFRHKGGIFVKKFVYLLYVVIDLIYNVSNQSGGCRSTQALVLHELHGVLSVIRQSSQPCL